MPATAESESAITGESVSRRILALFTIGFFLVLIGIAVIIVASLSSDQNGSVSMGAVIFIGPLPIVLGVGPDASWLIIVSIILAVLTIVMILATHQKPVKKNVE
jgi:uncharacterized membrane protein